MPPVLVVKNGKIAFHKAYGHHTYDRKQVVKLNDMYDLASVTKIAATTISLLIVSFRLMEPPVVRLVSVGNPPQGRGCEVQACPRPRRPGLC